MKEKIHEVTETVKEQTETYKNRGRRSKSERYKNSASIERVPDIIMI